MKRLAIALSVVMVLAFAGAAAAADCANGCCLYGCGIIKGTVKLCGSFIGQEGAKVMLKSKSGQYFSYTETYTDAEGFYKFRGTLPVCFVHTGKVKGEFVWKKCCGAPDELWKAESEFRFRQMNQNEQITLRNNLKLRYAMQLP